MGDSKASHITIERDDDRLVICVRTRRGGDLVHFAFGPLAVVFGALVLWIGLSRGTLLSSWATLPLVIACMAYGWFALTRWLNSRTLVATAESLSISDAPLPSLARGFTVPLGQMGKVTARSEKRWIPPIYFHRVHHVSASGAPRPLFRSLDLEEDAIRIKAALGAFLARERPPLG